MHTPYITIDTDNAIIRFYASRAAAEGLTPAGINQLHRDLETMATAMSHISGARFLVDVVTV